MQSFLWVWLRNQNDRDGPKKFNVTNLSEYKTTRWTTENIFYHTLRAMTFKAFFVNWNWGKLTPESNPTIKSIVMITMF